AGVGTAKVTLGSTGAVGVANPTGFTTGGGTINTTNAGINAGGTAAANPSSAGILSTIPIVVQNSGSSAAGSIAVQQNPIATTIAATGPFTPVQDGGGLFRGFISSGPDTTTFLNSSGATTGTQAQIIVSSIPNGATVVFPATVQSSSGLTVWTMTLVGS